VNRAFSGKGIRGAGFYGAQLNGESPIGTIQSIEYTLRPLDKSTADERERLAREDAGRFSRAARKVVRA
jgi:hypothetical protein